MLTVTVIGLGEVGSLFVEALSRQGHRVSAYDTAFADPASQASARARLLRLDRMATLESALSGVELVVSAVTPGNAVAAAGAAAPHLAKGVWYLDLTSCSPGHKRAAAALVDSHGARFIEAVLMSSISPAGLTAPFLLGGPHAQEFLPLAAAVGLSGARLATGPLGQAAATKLCRSVLIKGMEALFTEAMLAARAYGVSSQVLASLDDPLPTADWEQVARYFLTRSLVHGRRRSEEMLEAAETVREVGVDPLMAMATAARQRWAGELDLGAVAETLPGDELWARVRDAAATPSMRNEGT